MTLDDKNSIYLLPSSSKGSHVFRTSQGHLKANDPRGANNKGGSQPGCLFGAIPPYPTQRFVPVFKMSLLHYRLYKLSLGG